MGVRRFWLLAWDEGARREVWAYREGMTGDICELPVLGWKVEVCSQGTRTHVYRDVGDFSGSQSLFLGFC